jgi:hypothetical protein
MSPLTPLVLKQLEGSTHLVASTLLAFEKSSNHLPAAREGGEGYAVPVLRANKRHMLKSYFLPTHERNWRTTFLSTLRLGEVLPTLEAAPHSVIDARLPQAPSGEIAITGYLAPLIEGETFESLLNEQYTPERKARLALARQLCGTIRVLESSYVAHGDLAMSNVMITDIATGKPNLKLIDFDGFFHPVVPKIPCSRERGGRGFGQDGYRHRAYATMDKDVAVTSDRAAMAALAFELVTLQPSDFDELNRTTVLDQLDINAGKPTTSDTIIRRWPEGWKLVQRAFAATRPEFGPSPSEWYELVSTHYSPAVTPPPPPASRNSSRPSFHLRVVELGQPERRVNLSGTGNSFASVSSRLAWLSYARAGTQVVLQGTPPAGPIFLTRANSPSKLPQPLSLPLEPGDALQWDEFKIEVG